MEAIIICTTINRTDWLKNCLDSFKGYNKYPIITLMINEGKGRFADFIREIQKLPYDEFVLLQDSMEIKNPEVFDICFAEDKSVSLASTPEKFGNFHGKFIMSIFRECHIPEITSKEDDVVFEINFSKDYLSKCGKYVELCDLAHTNNFEEKFGRLNMVTENDYIKKYKGSWTLEMARQI
jgi:hypothetical protein